MCLYPRTIKNPKYRENKKNQGIIPHCKDERLLWINIPCGKCIECHKAKARQWTTRLMQEIKDDPTGHFVTLTLNTENLKALTTTAMENGYTWGYSLDNAVGRLAVRRFYERWRKNYGGKTLKHWLITELGKGETEHMHLHGILWTNHPERIEKTWAYGYIHIGKYTNQKTVNYMTKYFLKQDDRHPNYKPIVLASKGIGKGYLTSHLAGFNRYQGKETKEFYTTDTGAKIALAKYYRDKIYTDEQREELRLHKEDSPIKYVAGQRTNTFNNLDEYAWLLNAARHKNQRLGYKDPNTWINIEKENQRRADIQKKRLDTITQKTIPSETADDTDRRQSSRRVGRKPTTRNSKATA